MCVCVLQKIIRDINIDSRKQHFYRNITLLELSSQ